MREEKQMKSSRNLNFYLRNVIDEFTLRPEVPVAIALESIMKKMYHISDDAKHFSECVINPLIIEEK